MPNRILKESINESKPLSEVSFFAEDLFKRLITYADDYGRFNADYQIMRARLYPRELQIVSENDIEDALIELSGAGKIAFYTSDARQEIYGCFPNWHKHQRIRDSKNKCPDPSDTSVNDWYLRRFIPINLKKKVIENSNFKCQICGKYIVSTDNASVLIKMGAGLYHIDHIVPVEQGGRATEENLRLTCPKCNLSRQKYFTPEEIIELTQKENFAESCGNSPRVAKNICYNPIQSESNSNPNTETLVSRFQDFFSAYPKQKNLIAAEKEYNLLLFNDQNLTEHELIIAAENYADAVCILGTDDRYIKNPDRFLKDGTYIDYLDANYTKPKPPAGKRNANTGIMRADYGDLSELEKELLSN